MSNKREGIQQSVTAETRRKYARLAHNVERTLPRNHHGDVSEGILAFLEERSRTHDDIEAHVAALAFMAKVASDTRRLALLRDEGFRTAVSGFLYRKGVPVHAVQRGKRMVRRKVKGAIRKQKLVQIVRLAERTGRRRLALAAMMAYAAWLRPGELKNLHAEHVRTETDEGPLVFIAADKRRNARTRKGRRRLQGTWKPLRPGCIRVAELWREAVTEEGQKPFVEIARELNALIKQTATLHHWPAHLVWETYGLRHGAVVDARLANVPWADIVAFGAWSSEETPREIYGRLGRELLI
jgi:ribosomal protein S28E/S33